MFVTRENGADEPTSSVGVVEEGGHRGAEGGVLGAAVAEGSTAVAEWGGRVGASLQSEELGPDLRIS